MTRARTRDGGPHPAADDPDLALAQLLGDEVGGDVRSRGADHAVEPPGAQLQQHLLVLIIRDDEARRRELGGYAPDRCRQNARRRGPHSTHRDVAFQQAVGFLDFGGSGAQFFKPEIEQQGDLVPKRVQPHGTLLTIDQLRAQCALELTDRAVERWHTHPEAFCRAAEPLVLVHRDQGAAASGRRDRRSRARSCPPRP